MIRIRVDQRLAAGSPTRGQRGYIGEALFGCSLLCRRNCGFGRGVRRGCSGGVGEAVGGGAFLGLWALTSLWQGLLRVLFGYFGFDCCWPLPGGKGLWPSVEGLLGVFGALLPPLLRVLASIIAAFGCPWWGQRLFSEGLGAEKRGTLGFISRLLPSRCKARLPSLLGFCLRFRVSSG